jgi:hypothetical protein
VLVSGVDLIEKLRDHNRSFNCVSEEGEECWQCEAADEVERLNRLEAEAWGIRFCCNERDCGCQGRPVDPPAWWTPDIKALQEEIERLREALERLGSTETLTGPFAVPQTAAGDELVARIGFARAALHTEKVA